MFKFEKLKVWQKALDFSADIHSLTRRFPKEERYILTSQIKRAADSVVLNIAEGSTGQSNAEFKQFIRYALRSALEVVACLYIGKKRDLVSSVDSELYVHAAQDIIKMLQGLKKAI